MQLSSPHSQRSSRGSSSNQESENPLMRSLTPRIRREFRAARSGMAIFASGCRIEALVSFDRNKTNTTRQKHHDRNRTTLLAAMSTEENSKPWRFVTNHTQVLLCISRDPDVRMKAIAGSVGITERAAQRIVRDLIESGF